MPQPVSSQTRNPRLQLLIPLYHHLYKLTASPTCEGIRAPSLKPRFHLPRCPSSQISVDLYEKLQMNARGMFQRRYRYIVLAVLCLLWLYIRLLHYRCRDGIRKGRPGGFSLPVGIKCICARIPSYRFFNEECGISRGAGRALHRRIPSNLEHCRTHRSRRTHSRVSESGVVPQEWRKPRTAQGHAGADSRQKTWRAFRFR